MPSVTAKATPAEPATPATPPVKDTKLSREETRAALEDVMRHLGQAGGNAQAIEKLQAVLDKLK